MSNDLFGLERGGFVKQLAAWAQSSTPSRKEGESLFGDLLAHTTAPPPPEGVQHLFAHPAVLQYLTANLTHGFMRVPYDCNWSYGRSGSFLRVRELSAFGLYPNIELRCNRAAYKIHGGIPYLLTANSSKEEAKWSFGSELADWSRQELRIAMAISCTAWGGFTAYLSSRAHDIPETVVSHVEPAQRFNFALECASLVKSARERAPRHQWRDGQDSSFYFEFGDFRAFHGPSRRLAAGFRVSNPLLLSTARHFLKASMMWRADGFDEDGFAHLLFALEGCMLMFQDAENRRTERLDRRFLRQALSRIYLHGESVFRSVEEALGWGGTRAQLIHPHLALETGWKPFMMAEDYFEFHKLVRALLTYLLTGRSFQDYELLGEGNEASPRSSGKG